MFVRRIRALTLVGALVSVAVSVPQAQTKTAAITSPKAHFGFNIGDDYQLATTRSLSTTGRRSTRNPTG